MASRYSAALEQTFQDLAYAVRTLRRSRGFTAVAVLTLALGIGSATAVFSIVDTVLLRGLPYRNPGRLHTIYEISDAGQFRVPSYPTFADWQLQGASVADAIEGLAYVRGDGFTLPGPDGPEQFIAAYPSPGFFTLMGTPAALGRAFQGDDERPGAPAVAVLSWPFFVERYGADSAAIGTVVDVNSVPSTIIGVMPPGFAFPNFVGTRPPSLWVPINVLQPRTSPFLSLRGLHVDSRAIVRLGAAVDSARAVAAMRTIERRLAEAYPAEQAHWSSVVLRPISDELLGSVRPMIVLLAGAIALVLLLACANVANLQLVRGSVRERELALRSALGAGRWRIARLLLTETALLALTAGALGVLFASAILAFVRQAAADRLPFTAQMTINTPVALFALAVSALAALLVGVAPAIRPGSARVMDRLRSAGAAAGGSARERRLRSSLVAVQFAFALTLLIGAGLLIQSFRRLQAVRLGYEPAALLSFAIVPPSPKYVEAPAAAALYAQLLDALRAIPGVEHAAASGGALLDTKVETDDWPAGRPPPVALYHPVSEDYLRALGTPLVAGRWFTADDMRSANGFVVNESLAKALASGASVLGRRITVYRASQARADFGQPITLPIVGVVADIREGGRESAPTPEVYLPYTLEVWPWMNFAVRATNPARVLSAVTRAVQGVEPGILFRRKPSTELHSLAAAVAQRRFVTLVLGGFAGCALLLAAIGLYGVVAYAVAQRTREVGIRVALGASERSILVLVLGEGARFVVAGAVVGLVAAVAATRLLRAMLFETTTTDTPTFVVVTVLLGVVAMAASWLPARRAARIDPTTALRAD